MWQAVIKWIVASPIRSWLATRITFMIKIKTMHIFGYKLMHICKLGNMMKNEWKDL